MDARDPIDTRVGWLASLAEAASLTLTGAGLYDARRREAIALALLDCAVEMAKRLEADTEGAEYPSG